MTSRSWFPISALLALVLVGCAARGAHNLRTPDHEGVVRGTVAYRERLALPPDTVVEVWMTDVSPLIMAVPVIARTTILPEGRQVPLPFELHFDRSKIEPDHIYAVNAAIRSAGGIAFSTETPYHVTTKGDTTQANLILVRTSEGSDSDTSGLQGTAWRLEDLGGTGVLDGVQATLEFPEAGKVAGSGSCNRFFGTVEILGESITFGPLGSTRMSCVEEAVMDQEVRYLSALQDAERFTLSAGAALLVHCKGIEEPLRFVPKEQ